MTYGNYPDGCGSIEQKCVFYECPICGADAEIFRFDDDGNIIGCDECFYRNYPDYAEDEMTEYASNFPEYRREEWR